jgi:hypothetical protein
MAVIKQAEKQPHSRHQTQWAAQFAVASELCKRGYQVALTMGNHPVVDLMVVSPKGVQFLVDVKGLHRGPNLWQVRRKEEQIKNCSMFSLWCLPIRTRPIDSSFLPRVK